MTQGLWVIVGLLAFLLLEKMFPDQDSLEDPTSNSDLNFNCPVSDSTVTTCFMEICSRLSIGVLLLTDMSVQDFKYFL